MASSCSKRWTNGSSVAEEIAEADIIEVTISGSVLRLRPNLMTVSVVMAGLLPILWSSGTGRRRRIGDHGQDGQAGSGCGIAKEVGHCAEGRDVGACENWPSARVACRILCVNDERSRHR